MPEWLDITRAIAQIVGTIAQAVIAFYVYRLLRIVNWEKYYLWSGIEKVNGYFAFHGQSRTPFFQVVLVNSGGWPQKVDSVCNEKDNEIANFYGQKGVDDEGCCRLLSGKLWNALVSLTPNQLFELKHSKSLYIRYKGKKNLIAVEENIKKALKEYEEHKKKH